MKKYKRTRIIANLAVMGSLAWSSTTFAASTMPVTWNKTAKDNTNISVSRPTRDRPASTTDQFGKKKGRNGRGEGVRLKQGMMSLQHGGDIVSVTSDGFTLQKYPMGPLASSTPLLLTVRTSTSTVYMKDGKLDSVTDLASGQHVRVTGPLDVASATIAATGVEIITNPRPRNR